MMRLKASKDSSRGFQTSSEISFLINARNSFLTSSQTFDVNFIQKFSSTKHPLTARWLLAYGELAAAPAACACIGAWSLVTCRRRSMGCPPLPAPGVLGGWPPGCPRPRFRCPSRQPSDRWLPRGPLRWGPAACPAAPFGTPVFFACHGSLIFLFVRPSVRPASPRLLRQVSIVTDREENAPNTIICIG